MQVWLLAANTGMATFSLQAVNAGMTTSTANAGMATTAITGMTTTANTG
jgi:hypothetical protein